MIFSRTLNSVTVDYMQYIGAWGKQPKGSGTWAFFFGNEQHINDAHFYKGTFAECTRRAVLEARAAGFDLISVGS